MSLLIDIHCHLDHAKFSDLDKNIDNAKKAGVKLILTNGVNPETNRIALNLAKKYDIVQAALGIYPINQLTKEIKEGAYPLKLEKSILKPDSVRETDRFSLRVHFLYKYQVE